jgi:hypothetical protein
MSASLDSLSTADRPSGQPIAVAARTRPPDPARVLLYTVLTVLGVIFSIPLAWLMGVRGGDLEMFCWAALTFLVAMVPVFADQLRPLPRRHIMLTVITLVFMAHFVIPILTLYIPTDGPMDPAGMAGASLSSDAMVRSQQIALLGLCSFLIGYALPVARAAANALPQRRYEWTETAGLTAGVLLIAVGWLITLGTQFGLIPDEFGSGFLGGISNSVLFGAAWLTATYLVHRSRTALLLLVTMVPIVMGFNFLTGSKRLFLTPPAMIVLTWIVTERRIRSSWVVAGVTALILLYPVAQFWRDDVLMKNTLTAADILRRPGPAFERTTAFLKSGRAGTYLAEGLEATGRRIDAVGHAAVVIRDTPRVSPFQNGRTLALIPVAFIPRILWPDKPTVTTGQWITDTYTFHRYRVDSRIGVSWVGEFYINFAVPGVIVGMLVLGTLLRFAHEVILRRPPTIPLTIAAVIVLYTVGLAVQGGVVGVVNRPIFTLIPLGFAHLAIRLLGGTRPARS